MTNRNNMLAVSIKRRILQGIYLTITKHRGVIGGFEISRSDFKKKYPIDYIAKLDQSKFNHFWLHKAPRLLWSQNFKLIEAGKIDFYIDYLVKEGYLTETTGLLGWTKQADDYLKWSYYPSVVWNSLWKNIGAAIWAVITSAVTTIVILYLTNFLAQ